MLLFIIATFFWVILTPINWVIVCVKYGIRNKYFLETAIDIDRFGNRNFRTLLNLTLQKNGYLFGDDRETISSALGKNQRDSDLIYINSIKFYYFWKKHMKIQLNSYSKLTIFGNIICNILDTIDKGHCKKSIKEF